MEERNAGVVHDESDGSAAMTEHAVVIAGGGPTGMMLAAELALAQVDVAVVERRPDHVLVGSARFSLYQLRIENGEATAVASELQAEIAKPSPVLPPDTLLVLLAHAYDAQGNGLKSKEAYKRITTEYPDSPYALEAQRRVGPA